jgi:superkiller protein 3
VYEQAIHLNPNDALAYTGKGAVLHNLERYEEALMAYEEALRLNPKNALAYTNKGLTLDRLGRSIEAQQARKKARGLGLA